MNKSILIVKVQVPLAASDGNPPCFVYAEGKAFAHTIPCTPEIREKVGGAKAYFYSVIIDGEPVIDWDNKAPAQEW